MNGEITIPHAGAVLVLRPIHERAIRIRFVPEGAKPESPSVTLVSPASPSFTTEETAGAITVSTSHLRAVLDKANGSLTYFDPEGNVLLEEIPGTRKVIPGSVGGEPCFAVEQAFVSPPGEHLHGLGQFQDGHFNLKGHTRKLVQVNTQISIPFLLSSRGYGLLWHQYGLTDFNPANEPVALAKDPEEGPEYSITVTGSTGEFTETCRVRTYRGEINIPRDGDYAFLLDYGVMTNRHLLKIDGAPVIEHQNFWLPPTASARAALTAGSHRVEITATKGEPVLAWRAANDATVLRSPHAEALDYVVFAGPNPNDIIAAFRAVSGPAPLLPRWAYGFWQCRERYATQAELLENAREYRARRLPVDVMVQDWQYWPREQWAGMQFDPARYPDPTAMMSALRSLDMRLIISVWENVSKDSDLGREYEASGLYVRDSPWLDMTNPAARAAHWNAIEKRLASHGIDGWWLDATEPENDALAGKRTHLGPGELHRLTYPLYVSQAIFEGERSARPQRRVCILTRSAYPGQQRYNSITWSGDVGWDWDAFRRQIVAGLNYCASGLPYWTTDIGGFFRPDDQYTSPAYREILTRWFQFGAFNPIFRIHGFGSQTEVWRYGPEFEAAARAMLDLRYSLLPYIYSTAWQVASRGATFMRPLVMDFPSDPRALAAEHQFLFGPAFLVAPVTRPGVESWTVYLPAGTDWVDFWSGQRHGGGQHVTVASPLDRIPLFVRAGSILILGPLIQNCGENATGPMEVRVYPGADAEFTLYEDEGDGHAYERGESTTIRVTWAEAARTVIIGARQGSYAGMPAQRHFRLVPASPGPGIGTGEASRIELTYNGTEISSTL